MPPREQELPEGTDHVVQGASGSSGVRASGSSGGSGGGFVAKGGGESGGTTDKLVAQVRDQVTSLRGQATDRLRGFADDGKGRATGLLDDFSEVINDAARSIDDKFGEDYGQYAHQAAEAVSSFAGRLREKSVDDLVDDTREVVKASPAVAIGIAAVAGFALMRILRTGMDELSGGRSEGRSGGSAASRGSGGSGGRRRTNTATTAGGGA